MEAVRSEKSNPPQEVTPEQQAAKIIIEDLGDDYFSPEALDLRDQTIRMFLKHMETLNTHAKPTLEAIEAFEKWLNNYKRFELDLDTQEILNHRVATEFPWASQILGMHGDRGEAERDLTSHDLNAITTPR